MPATGFTGDIASSFPPANALFDPMMARRQTEADQTAGMNEAEMVARVSQGLLDPKLYPDEASRAAAWGPAVQQLRGLGFAQKAPDQYPGEATLRRAALLGTSSTKQAEWNYNTGANQAALGPAPAAPGAGTGTAAATPAPAPSGPGYAPSGTGTPYVAPNLPQGVTAEEDQAVRTVIGEAGAEPVIGQAAVAHVIRNRSQQSGKSVTDVVFAPNQFEPWNNPTTRARLEAIDPTSAQYQTILNNVVRPTFSGQSQDPTGGATHFFSPTAQAQLGREPPSWAANQTPAVIGRHNFYNIGYRAPGGGAAQVQAPGGDTGPVILGDSLASPQGMGGSGVVGAKPGQVLEQIQAAAKDGRLQGRDVVISSGASNAPSEVARVEEQIREAKKGGAKSVTVTGVGTRPDIVGSNAIIQQIAEKHGARFVPVDPSTLSGDQVHPENYGPLKQAVGAAPAAPGGVQQPGPYRVAGAVVAPPAGPPGATPTTPPALLAPGTQGAPAAGTVQPVPVAQNQIAPVPAPARPAAPAPPRPSTLGADNLTDDDRRQLAGMVRDDPAKFTATRAAMQARNIQQQQTAFENQRQVTADAVAAAERDYTHLRNTGADQRAIDEAERQAQAARIQQQAEVRNQAKFDQEMVAANRPYPGNSPEAADNNILVAGSQPGGDPSSVEYRNAYARQKYKETSSGATMARDMSMFKPPVVPGGGTADVPPTVTSGPGQIFERENKLRDEFQKLTADFRVVQNSYENLHELAKKPSGAGDMSLLYSYVRLLDPTSVVRESEFATAAASGSFGERVQGAVGRILSGERLPDSLRDDFVREAGNLYKTQLRNHNQMADTYTRLAEDSGVDPKKVVTRFDRPQGPSVGAVEEGYRFKGGDPANRNNWEKVN